MARSGLSESAGRWIGHPRRALAPGAAARSSGPRSSFDDGRDLATCSSFENGHLRYLRYLWANCDGCVVLCALCAFVPLCLCGSTWEGRV